MKKLLIYLSLLFSMFLFIFIPGFKVKAEDDYVLKPTDVLISSDDLKSVSGDAIKGNLTYADIQEIMSNNPDYDFVSEYKYFVILLKHWDRSNINGNVLEIMFFDKQPLISDTILVTNEVNRLTYTVGKINSNFIINFDNLDLTQSLEYESLYRSSTDISKEFANGVYYLAFDNLNPSSYIKPQKYHEIINSRKYSKVEFVFEVPNMEANLNFNYDFHLVDSTGNLDTLNTFKSPYFEETYTSCGVDESGASYCKPLPVVDNFAIEEANDGQCHIDDFGLNNCYKPIDYSNKLNVYNSYIVKNYDLLINNNINKKMTTKLKLILDLEFNSSVYVDATFYSSLSYEVKYYERTTTVDYYSTVDLTGKYGALFIPKFDNLEDSLTIRTLFKGIGHLDIQHRSSYDYINYQILSAYSMNYCNEYLYNQDAIPYSCSEFSGEYEFYVSNNNLEQALFFVNSAYENETGSNVSITYDTRYYIYYVFDTPTSIVAVVNPNTGDKTYISLDDFYNYADVDSFFLKGLVNQFYTFFNEKFPVVSQFKMIINLFNFNEDYDDPPVLKVSLSSIGIDEEVQIVDFSIFNQYRSTVIFWEMLFLTTFTVVKVTNNVVKAFKGD